MAETIFWHIILLLFHALSFSSETGRESDFIAVNISCCKMNGFRLEKITQNTQRTYEHPYRGNEEGKGTNAVYGFQADGLGHFLNGDDNDNEKRGFTDMKRQIKRKFSSV